MISRAQFNAYDMAIKAIEDNAADMFNKQFAAFVTNNPAASVAETRNAAISILTGLSDVYQGQATALAAQWYDAQASAAGMVLEDAITVTEYKAHTIERVAHYKSQKLVDGDTQGFITECQRYLMGEVRKTINATVLKNCERDRRKGVRFARVPMGTGTCAFCYMLSSKGAVYHSRETAGEQNHWHNDCRCKIVPGFKTDPLAEIVEGYRPDIMQENYREISKACGIDWNNGDFAGNMRKFQRDMQYRDINWLYTGIAPEPTFVDDRAIARKLEKWKTLEDYMAKDPEYQAIKRFCKLGYNGQIVDDVINNYQGTGKSVGLADLTRGMEIKHFTGSVNNIGRPIRDSYKKLDVACVMIDTTDNVNVLDHKRAVSKLKERAVQSSKQMHDVVVLWQDGKAEHLFF